MNQEKAVPATLTFVSTLPEPSAFEALMRAYYQGILPLLAEIGGPSLNPADMVADTMAHLPEALPPRGRLLLATGEDGALLGCAMLRPLRPDAAEMKRMYLAPAARGQGLGRKLFEMRIEEARRMGLKTLYADTVKGNRPMLTMYERFGFRYIPRYPGNANPPEFEPFLVYLEYQLC